MSELPSQNTNEEIFHDVLNQSVDWVWRATPDAVFTYLSHSLKTMTGFDPEELIGRPFKEYAPLLFTKQSIDKIVESLGKRKGGGILAMRLSDLTWFINAGMAQSLLGRCAQLQF